MKKYTLLGHVFELEENAYHFLARYIERIEQYAATHTISHEVIDDIKYSIIEKLYRYETPVTESQVIEVANVIGEPEVMFDETDENTDSDVIDKTRKFAIDKEKPMIRGVCYRLAKSMNVPVRIMRIIFIILSLVNGAGLILYAILALFVPFKDKRKTTGALGNIFFEIVRVAFWLFILCVIVPLTISAIVATALMLFTPLLDNQSIGAWIPQYMYVVGVLMSISLVLLSIGSIGALLKQRWLNKTLGLLAVIIIVAGGVVTIGTGYKTAIQVMSNQTTVEQNMVFTGEVLSGDRVNINMNDITDYADSWPYVGMGSADVRIIRTSGSNISIQVKSTLRGQSDIQVQDTASKLQPLTITGNASDISIVRTGKLFTSEVPFAGVHRHIIIAVPSDKEVFLNKDSRTNMYVQNDGRGRGYCAAKVYVYNPNVDEFTCKNGSGEVFYDVEDDDRDFDDMMEDEIEQRIRAEMQQSIDRNREKQGLDAVPPMYQD